MNSYLSGGTISERSTLEETTDELLVTAAKLGEDWAFSELCNRHSKKIFNTMYRITRNRQDAEDALQDAFLKAFLHLKNFDWPFQLLHVANQDRNQFGAYDPLGKNALTPRFDGWQRG